MCNHYVCVPQDELEEIVAQVEANLAALGAGPPPAKGTDAFPGTIAPVIVPDGARLLLAAMQWGFPKPWGEKGLVVNTRADTAAAPKRSMWTKPLQQGRCLVPAHGFYEPHKTQTAISQRTGKPIKQQYYFTLPGSPVLMMAGIYEAGHFSIMTTEPNQWMAPIHPRMPVVLRPDEYTQWLQGDYTALFDRSQEELLAAAV